jgi:hypothetical protein
VYCTVLYCSVRTYDYCSGVVFGHALHGDRCTLFSCWEAGTSLFSSRSHLSILGTAPISCLRMYVCVCVPILAKPTTALSLCAVQYSILSPPGYRRSLLTSSHKRTKHYTVLELWATSSKPTTAANTARGGA